MGRDNRYEVFLDSENPIKFYLVVNAMVGFSGDQKPPGIKRGTMDMPPTKWVVFDAAKIPPNSIWWLILLLVFSGVKNHFDCG